MYSLMQTSHRGYKEGEVPFDEYDWGDQPLWILLEGGGRGASGFKRIDTKRFIRFEHLRVIKKKNAYWHSRTSHWFIRFPYCKNDKQVLIANIVVCIIAFPLLLKILSALVGLAFGLIL